MTPRSPQHDHPGKRLASLLRPANQAIAAGTAVLLLLGTLLFWRARAGTNRHALAGEPKGVTVVEVGSASYRPSRRFVGTLEPWVQANVGPQLVSAYIDTVLVRPGAKVKRGQVLATLDCSATSAMSRAASMQARALQATQEAQSHEAARVQSLEDGGFVSRNEVEQETAQSSSRQAQLLALQAQTLGTSLQVNDCILRAPFEGEVADRMKDPGAFVKPGTPIVSVVDRRLIRVSADVPETDFGSVDIGTPVKLHVLATGQKLTRPIARRAPAADPATRTIHVEIDIEDPEREIPVYTTAELSIDVGVPVPAAELPLAAAAIRGEQANVYVVEGDRVRARSVRVLGESGGRLFLDPALAPGSQVVLEGRMLLADGDRVLAKTLEAHAAAPPLSRAAPRPLP